MKTKILLFFCCLLTIACIAQDSSFHLKNYKYRTSGYKALELSISFNGNTGDYKESNAPNQTNNLFQLFPSSINYRNFFSTDKRWHALFVSVTPSFLSHTQKGAVGKAKGRNFQSSLDFSTDDRFYGNKQWFFQLGNHLFARGDFTKQSSIQANSKTNVSGVDEDLFIGFGKGRTEMVQDAQMALFILNDLSKQGLLTQNADAKTITEFAQLITQINNRRIFDSRRKRMFELTQIDSFLRVWEITSSPDIRHFTIINDNWALAFNPERLSGSDWFFQLRPSIEAGKNEQTTKSPTLNTTSEGRTTVIGIGPRAGYESYKPINLKWQRNFGSSVSWQLQKSKNSSEYAFNGSTTKTKTETEQYQSELNAFYGIGFYPNNRTRLNATLDVKGTHTKYRDSVLKRSILLQPSFAFSTDYFISYRTRMFANFYLFYNKEYYKSLAFSSFSRRSFGMNLSVGITHSFF